MATTKMDLGTADVHQPGALAPNAPASAPKNRAARRAAKAKAKGTKGPRKGLRMTIDHPQHGRFEIRHMSDGSKWVQGDGVELAATLADKNGGPVWIQLAKVGAFRGHAAGPFELTPATFSEIVANFRATADRRIPIDFEHASESEPTEGSIPTAGAPAQGWIVDLDNRGEGGLWGLVEWGALAREYIRNGQYRFFSPAIRFNARDRVTGKPVGARMTSGALTNNPFLDGLKPLAAKDAVAPGHALSSYSAHEFMPRIKAALSMHPLASAAACKQCLTDLADMVARGRGAMQVDGVDLMNHLGPLRELANMPAHCSWPEIISVIDTLIDSAMDQHLEEAHGAEEDEDEAEMADAAAPGNEPVRATDNEARASATETEHMANDEVTALSARVADLEKDKASINAKSLKFEADNAALATKLSDAEAKVASLESENKMLRDTHAKWESAAAERDVEEAIANAKGTNYEGVFCSDRKAALLDWRRTAPKAFADSAPPRIEPSTRHLFRDLATSPAGGRDQAPQINAREGLVDATKRLMRDEKITYEAALAKASRARKAG